MYLKAFTASEYSAYEFLRMVQAHKPLAGRGMKGMWQWQRGQELENIQLQVVQGGEVVETAPWHPTMSNRHRDMPWAMRLWSLIPIR